MNETPQWKCVLKAQAQVGECPIWAPENSSLYWVDALAPSMNRLDLSCGVNQTWRMPCAIGSYGLAADLRSCVVALADGIHRLEFDNGALIKLHDAPYDVKHYRFNDGRVDRAGRFWVGTLRRPESDEPPGRGAFWRLDKNGLVRAIDGVTVANGIAWSPDDRTMYIADRIHWHILAMDFDVATGTVSNQRTFARVPEGVFPDGAAVDSEGCYWSAQVTAGKVARYAPDGVLLREIAAPVPTPTMLAFGGADLKTLFVTTARLMLKSAAELEAYPLTGGIFSLEVDVPGVPEPRLR